MTDERVSAGAGVSDFGYTLSLRPGVQLGVRYTVLRLLGGTSEYALTYLAHDAETGGAVVIKELLPRALVARAADGLAVRAHSAEDGRELSRALRRFVREAETVSELRQEALPEIVEVFEANGTAYAVMRHYDVDRLSDQLAAAGGRFSVPTAIGFGMRLLGALEALHGEGIVHREVSPHTVHVCADGSALLLGLGAWRHVPGRTREPIPGFSPIEHYGGRDVGPWSDVYGASALLYYMLTGFAPPSAIERVGGAALRPPSLWATDVTPALTNTIVRGLALGPEGRPHSAAELRRQLEDARTAAPTLLPSPARPFALEPGVAGLPDGELPDDDPGTARFTLNAFGVVVPREESGMGRALRRVTGVAARLTRRSGEVAEAEAMDGVRLEAALAQLRPAEPPPGLAARREASPAESSSAPVLDDARAPLAHESTSIVPAAAAGGVVAVEPSASAVAGPESALAALAVALDERRPSRARRVGTLLVGGALLAGLATVGVFGPVRLALTAGRTTPGDSVRSPTSAANLPAARAIPAATPVLPGSASVALQGNTRAVAPVAADSIAPGASSSKVVARVRAERSSRSAELPSVPAIASPAIVLPDGAASEHLAGEVVVDARSQISVAREQADQGNYAAARRALSGALTRIDSAATGANGAALRDIRREVESALRRTTDACGAESEMRRRRGLAALSCS